MCLPELLHGFGIPRFEGGLPAKVAKGPCPMVVRAGNDRPPGLYKEGTSPQKKTGSGCIGLVPRWTRAAGRLSREVVLDADAIDSHLFPSLPELSNLQRVISLLNRLDGHMQARATGQFPFQEGLDAGLEIPEPRRIRFVLRLLGCGTVDRKNDVVQSRIEKLLCALRIQQGAVAGEGDDLTESFGMSDKTKNLRVEQRFSQTIRPNGFDVRMTIEDVFKELKTHVLRRNVDRLSGTRGTGQIASIRGLHHPFPWGDAAFNASSDEIGQLIQCGDNLQSVLSLVGPA